MGQIGADCDGGGGGAGSGMMDFGQSSDFDNRYKFKCVSTDISSLFLLLYLGILFSKNIATTEV